MKRIKQIKWKYLKIRSRLRRFERLYFPSPAEVQAARLMGCRAIAINPLRSWRTGNALVFIIAGGWYRANFIERQVVVRGGGKYACLDFARPNDRIGLEIDGRAYHDILVDQERDEWAASLRPAWVINRLPAAKVNPASKAFDSAGVMACIIKWFA